MSYPAVPFVARMSGGQRGVPEKRDTEMKLTTNPQVSVDAAMEGNGGQG
jgi:hypothetical protein